MLLTRAVLRRPRIALAALPAAPPGAGAPPVGGLPRARGCRMRDAELARRAERAGVRDAAFAWAAPRAAPGAGGARRGLVTVVADVGAGRPWRTQLRRAVAKTLGRGRRAPLITDRTASYLGNGSFVLVALSFLSTDILQLRLLNVFAGLLMFAFNAAAMERPMWISMRWGMFLGAINVFQITLLLRERSVDILPRREMDAYRASFAPGRLLSELQFWRLAAAGEWQTLHRGTPVTIQGAPNEFVYILLSGEMTARRTSTADHERRVLGVLGPGSWIGERGFLRQFALPFHVKRETSTAPSVATVSVSSPEARVLRWRRCELQREMDRVPAVGAGVLLSMTRDVLRKLRHQTEHIGGEDQVAPPLARGGDDNVGVVARVVVGRAAGFWGGRGPSQGVSWNRAPLGALGLLARRDDMSGLVGSTGADANASVEPYPGLNGNRHLATNGHRRGRGQ